MDTDRVIDHLWSIRPPWCSVGVCI